VSTWPPPPPPPGYGPPGYGPPGYGPGAPPPINPGTSGPNPLAIASLVSGVVGILLSFCCGIFAFPVAVVAVATGAIGLSQTSSQQSEGRGLAIAGICCGVATLVLAVGFLFLSGFTSFSTFFLGR